MVAPRLSGLWSLTCALAVALSVTTHTAQATTGYFQIGHGASSSAMGGASISFFKGAISTAINPAGLLHLDPSFEISLMGFLPQRGGDLDTSKLFGEAVSVESENPFFLAPNMAANWSITPKLAVGITFYSSGGMNTEYKTNLFHQAFSKPIGLFTAAAAGSLGLSGSGPEAQYVKSSLLNAPHTGTLGVNLEQGVLAPSVAYKLNEQLSLGASLLVGLQRFEAQGLGDFIAFSQSPLALTNNGYDYSMGFGARLGLSYSPREWLRVGAVASSKVYMGDFKRYEGLFADGGNFDIPAHMGVGASVKLSPALTFSADLTRIMYEGVASISNPGPTTDELLQGFQQSLLNGLNARARGVAVPVNAGAMNPLGSADGYGFGWRSIWVAKVGAHYQARPDLELMLGYAYGQNPVQQQDALFNLIAPAVVQHHLTGGVSKRFKAHTLTLSYQHVLEGELPSEYRAGPEATTELAGSPNLELGFDARPWMAQQVVELSYGYTF